MVLAHHLGQAGIRTTVLERLDAPMTEPRAISLDGESLRTLQRLSLLDAMKDDILCALEADYVNGQGQRLFKVGRPEYRPYGYAMINAFDQPAFDVCLARSLSQSPNVTVLYCHTLTDLTQDTAGVRAHVTDNNGLQQVIEAQYLVGCDGGRSTVRALLGIEMEGQSNAQPWLVIDTRDAHLSGDPDCRFYCDPGRPGMTIRKQHGERRWEWMLMPGESREQLLEDATIRALIAPYTDADNVEIYRKRVYDFHALIASRWQEGRIFLAGDAAHMTPPFAGQGLNSGLRDAANLAWKLALVVNGQSSPALLESYEKDRRDHARELIRTALELGEQIQPIDPDRARERDAFFTELARDPVAMDAMEQDLARSVTDRQVDYGLILDSESSAPGSLLPQPRIDDAGAIRLLDEHLGSGFAILGVDCDASAVVVAGEQRAWASLRGRVCSMTTGHGQGIPSAPEEIDDMLREWLGTDAPVVVLVRPDRFCMAVASVENATAVLAAARSLLGHGVAKGQAGE